MNKKTMKNILSNSKSFFALILSLFLIGYIIISFMSLFFNIADVKHEIADLNQEYEDQVLQNEYLKNVKAGDTKEYMERRAREFGFVYPDEKIFYGIY